MQWFRKSKFESTLQQTVEAVVTRALRDTESALHNIKYMGELAGEVKKLRGEIETLEIEKSKREELVARERREIEHKVGLERRRQEQELALAKREAQVESKETALAKDQARFEAQMKFHESRFTEEVGYLKELMKNVLERLPSAKMSFDRTEVSEK